MTFVDRPLPETLELTPLREPKPRDKRLDNLKHEGRPKGLRNKITRDLKEGITTAAENIGRDGSGAGGLVGYLEDLALYHKRAFASLLVKVLPMQVNADVRGQHISTVRIISVPSDNYLSAADIERYRTPAWAHCEQIAPPGDVAVENLNVASESAPLIGHQDVFEPRTEMERRLLDRLEALSPEQLQEIAKQVGYVDADGG